MGLGTLLQSDPGYQQWRFQDSCADGGERYRTLLVQPRSGSYCFVKIQKENDMLPDYRNLVAWSARLQKAEFLMVKT